MFIGHFAPAFAARATTDEAAGLGKLFVAAQLVDIAFFTFAILGVEKMRIVPGITAMNPFDLYHMPLTHSLLGSAVFAAVAAILMGVFTRSGVAAAWTGIVVLSHWLLDLLVHRPDLTMAGGEEKYGFGLWNSPLVAMPLELAITGLAFWWYLRRTKGPIVPPMALMGVMLVFQAFNWFGPEPREAGIALYLTALFAYAIMAALAFWTGSTRWHRQQVGLAVASVRR
ncbi:hypothetical protein [Qipengyuania marisflavi]|uniref:Metal-dependent hydrolase n=1 Tax=Qipengyuania marisflavi TaxID=2486356 RepID=A0A5S3P8H3_9SPHN|nr:hypothetical protein [Qipengyuania marisflavi]TMM49802.1 hypothetical protein FEV51_00960 [Qipengyuania marisflavi]